MKALLACSLAVLLTIVGLTYYYETRTKRDIATYIDGDWINGEYRGCMLIPPERTHFYCGVNWEHKKLPWAEVLSDREHTHMVAVTFAGKPETVFWRCQKEVNAIKCKDAGVKTELR